jgi:hypothetical protein
MFFLEKCKEKTFAIVLKDIDSFNLKKDEIVFIEKIKNVKGKRFCVSIKNTGACFNIFDDELKSIDKKKSELDLDENYFLEMKSKYHEEHLKNGIPVICELIRELPNYWHVTIVHNQVCYYIPKNVVFLKEGKHSRFLTLRIVSWYYKKVISVL